MGSVRAMVTTACALAALLPLLGCGAKTGLPSPGPAPVDAGTDAPPVDAAPDVVPLPTADVCVELPYEEPPEQVRVSFEARIRSADVLLLVDVTGSMGDEIDRIRATLRDRIIPDMASTIPDVRFSVASFADFPVTPYGDGEDDPFRLLQRSTTDVDAVQRAVAELPEGRGGDGPESQVEALYQTATGEGIGRFVGPARCPSGTVGYPCFEPGTPIVLLFTDAEFHNGPSGSNPYTLGSVRPEPATYEEARTALNEIGAKVLGLFSGGMARRALQDLRQVARDTGAVSPGGEPIVVDIGTRGESLDEGVIETVSTLVEEVPIDVGVLVEDWPGDDYDGTRFVERVEALAADPPSGATRLDDRFDDVLPGTRVTFRILLQNELLPPAEEPRRYYLHVVLRGDGVTRLRETVIEVVIPGRRGGDCAER